MLMVGTDEKKSWVVKSDQGCDLKGVGYWRFSQNSPYKVFLAAANLKSAPLDRVAPLAAVVLIIVGIELHPHGLVCTTLGAMVYVERAPFPSAASRLPASTSNTCFLPLIRPYPPRQKIVHNNPPPLYRESVI
jgi:hypothetical protein